MDTVNRKIEELHHIVRKGIEEGLSNEEIEQKLSSYNLEPYYRQQLIQNIQNEKWDRKQFWRTLIAGVFVMAVGIACTLLSYFYTWSGSYLVLWGLMVSGVLLIIRASVYYRK